MNIDNLTVGQIKEIAALLNLSNGVSSTTTKNSLSSFAIGKKVIVRTYSAGVFVGILKERSGKEVILENSRRIWSWSGAFTLSKIAEAGLSTAKMAVVEPEKLVTECIEVIICSDNAFTKLMEIKSHE